MPNLTIITPEYHQRIPAVLKYASGGSRAIEHRARVAAEAEGAGK
jgi:hypothetical protein